MGNSYASRPPLGVRERRRFGRRLSVSLAIEIAGRSGVFVAQTVNVSRTGVLLWVADDRFLPLAEADNMVLFTERVAEEFGEGLEIRFAGEIAVEAEVVRVTRRGERDTGPVLVACRYARPLTREEWKRLDVEHRPPREIDPEMSDVLGPGLADRDRRRALRVPHEQPVEIHSDYAAYRARVVNVSAVGVLLQMTDPAFAAPGTADRLLVCTRRLGTQFGRGMRVRFLESDVTVEGEIVRVGERKSTGGSEILVGCRFDPPLDAATCARLDIDPPEATPAPGGSAPSEPAAAPARTGELLRCARESGATDLHLKAGSPPRARIGGAVRDLPGAPLTGAETHAIAQELLDASRRNRLERRGHAEAVLCRDGAGRLRVNAVRQDGAIALAVRFLPATLPALPPDLAALAGLEEGLVLLGGRGGSGRSTTLASLVDAVNRSRPCHVLVIEDPVEFPHREEAAHVTQRDLAVDGISVREALRQSRHLDVDVIAVGHLTQAADAFALLDAAEAGRLVFGVLDAAGADDVAERFLRLVPPDRRAAAAERLDGVLQAVAAQRLRHDAEGRARLEACVRRGPRQEPRRPSRNGAARD